MAGVVAPRTIITTDPELDDLNSMLRLLLYSNEIRIVGLVYSSSQFHYAGDPEAGVEPHRWPAPGSTFHIHRAVDAYAQVYPNLVVHDPRYPSPEHLRSLIAWGNVADVGDMVTDTEGSELVRSVLLDDGAGPLFLQVWGGHNTIARALKSIEDEFRGTDGWEDLRRRITDKAVITSFGQQDTTLADYIRPSWPGIESREVATRVWGYFARTVAAEEDQHLLGAEWMRENVTRLGPMGAAYRVWGDGEQMAEGFDDEDYFGLSGHTVEELEAMGYTVWMPPQEPGSFISEGDSSNWALLAGNGLRSWEHPSWGGWGGRQHPVSEPPVTGVREKAVSGPAESAPRRVADAGLAEPIYWTNAGALDGGPEGVPGDEWTSARWLGEFQRDFAARLRWSVTSTYGGANHHPEVTVAEGTAIDVHPGARVRLCAEVSDPDGDAVEVHWWQYREAGTCDVELELMSVADAVEFEVPADVAPGETLHVICTAQDSGAPPLTRHARVVLTTTREPAT